MIKDNVIVAKSEVFAFRIVRLNQYLIRSGCDRVLTRQLLKSGTSIGANIKEAVYAQSRPDFYTKMKITLKEAAETEYWLKLLHNSDYLNERQFSSIESDCTELIRLLTAITKSTKAFDVKPESLN